MKGRPPRNKVRGASCLSSHGASIGESRAEAVGVYVIPYGCFSLEEKKLRRETRRWGRKKTDSSLGIGSSFQNAAPDRFLLFSALKYLC